MKVLKMVRRLAMVLLVICVGLCLAVGVKGYRMYKGALAQTSLADKVDSIRAREDYTTFEELPPIYVEAVLSVEDHRFYSHPGIDPIAIGRAAFNDLKAMAFVEGGSTVTQQLAKNLYFSQEKELTRKVAEVFMAFDLEKNYSKEEILELYVNSIYFGNGYYSVAEASEGYFGKAPSEMTEYESTLLAGIPNAPSVYALTANPDLAAQRQRQVVDRMVTCGYYTEVQAQETLAAGM